MTDPVYVAQRFRASRERVFDAWLKPEIVRLWLFKSHDNEIVRVAVNPQSGGRFSILERAKGEDIDHFGVYSVIDRPNRLAFSLEVPWHFPGVTEVVVEITPSDEGCHLSLTQTGVDPKITEGPWRNMLSQLARLLAR